MACFTGGLRKIHFNESHKMPLRLKRVVYGEGKRCLNKNHRTQGTLGWPGLLLINLGWDRSFSNNKNKSLSTCLCAAIAFPSCQTSYGLDWWRISDLMELPTVMKRVLCFTNMVSGLCCHVPFLLLFHTDIWQSGAKQTHWGKKKLFCHYNWGVCVRVCRGWGRGVWIAVGKNGLLKGGTPRCWKRRRKDKDLSGAMFECLPSSPALIVQGGQFVTITEKGFL